MADIRAGAHSDYGERQISREKSTLTRCLGSLTLLFQRASQPGLEVLTPTSSWSPVDVYPPGTEDDPFPPILINIGDLMDFWTNGLLKSTVHRVVFPQGESADRYSVRYVFCQTSSYPNLSLSLQTCLPSFCSSEVSRSSFILKEKY